VRLFIWLYTYNQHDLSFVVLAGVFLWVAVSHCSSVAAYVFFVDGYSVYLGGAAFVVYLPFFSAFRAAALAWAGLVRSTYLSKISSSVLNWWSRFGCISYLCGKFVLLSLRRNLVYLQLTKETGARCCSFHVLQVFQTFPETFN
jgi:hypothetical protein